MADKDLPADISSTIRIAATPAIAEGEEKGAIGGSQSFASFMQGEKASPLAASGKTTLVSPFELAQGQRPACPISHSRLPFGPSQ